jgi:tetratricopeptide (TPR) repeat protein
LSRSEENSEFEGLAQSTCLSLWNAVYSEHDAARLFMVWGFMWVFALGSACHSQGLPAAYGLHRQIAAQLYAQMGQLGDAINEQNAALVLDPKNADDWNNRGVLHARNGDAALAGKDFEHA